MPKFSNPFLQLCARPPVAGASFVLLTVLFSIIVGTRSLLPLFSLEGLIIVAGGVIAVAFMSFRKDDVRRALQAVRLVFQEPHAAENNLHFDMMKIVAWASVIKEKGMRSLETSIRKSGLDDPFVKYGLNMVVSDYKPDEVRSMMETAADACYEHDSAPIDVLHAMASHAPAFGMIGTLVGMVIMLCNLNDNVSTISSSLAVAFLSTLYGVISARMVYMPAAARLQQEVDSRRFRYHLITEGMVMLVDNKNPMHVQDRLNSFLRPEIRDYFDCFKGDAKRAAKTPVPAARPLLKVVGA